MSSRLSFALAVLILLLAIGLRLWQATTLPLGFNPAEITDIRIAETVRQGRVEVFYNLGGEGREGLYDMVLAVVTGAVGGGLLGYRLLSIWAGLLALAFVYALVKWLYNPLAALAALALLAVNMWATLLSRLVGRESLLPLLVAAVLLALAYALVVPLHHRFRAPTTTPFAALGLLLGVGFYIHPSHFIIVLITMLFIVYVLVSRQSLTRRRLSYIGFAIVIMLVIVTPYLISSIRLPELAGAARVFTGIADIRPSPLQALGRGLAGFFLTGDANPVYNLPRRPLIDLVSGLFVIIGGLTCLRYIRQPRFVLPVIAALVFALVALPLKSSPNFVAFAPLLPLVALFFGVGVSTIYHSFPKRTRPFVYVGLAALLAFNVFWMARDFFARWDVQPEVAQAYNTRLGQLAHYLDKTGGTMPGVVCASDLALASTPQLGLSELMTLMMHRQTASIRYANCGTGMVFTRGGEREQIVFPEEGGLFDVQSYIRNWLMKGRLLRDPAVPRQSVVVLDVPEELADTVGRFTTTAWVSYAPESPGGASLVLPPVRFGDATPFMISFLGYEPFNVGTYKPGDWLTLITYWRVDGALPSNLRLFAHLLFDPVQIAAQSDTLDVLAAQLQPRDVFIQIMYLRLPMALPDGTYTLSIGAYEDYADVSSADTRLSVFDGDQPRGTRLFLGDIAVARPD